MLRERLTFAALTVLCMACGDHALAATNQFSDFDATMQALRIVQLLGLLICFIIVKAISARSDSLAKPAGIGGWLTLFLASSLCATFFTLLFESVTALKTDTGVKAGNMAVYIYLAAFFLFHLIFLYGIFCLCRIRPGAVTLMKKLLVGNFLVSLLAPAFMLVCLRLSLGYPELTPDNISEQYDILNYIGIGKSLLYLFVWYIYFSVSKRVKNTWPEALQ